MFPMCFTTTASPEIFVKRIAALAQNRAKLVAEIKARLQVK